MFIDETWIKTNMAPLRGWGPRGRRLRGFAPHGHWRTLTFLGALRCDGLVAPCVFEGPINGVCFRAYVEQLLVPTLRPGDIVVIDASRPLLSDRMFPRGTLREPVSGLRRCHAVVINGKTGPDADTDRVASEIRALGLTADVFLCEQSIERLVPFEAWARGAHHARLEGPMPPVFLVAALGNPQRFQNDVRKHGARVLGARFFRDHHRLDSDDWEACVRLARGSGARAFVTSEKDAMKISVPPSFPLLVSLQTTRIQGEDAYADLIRRTLEI